MSAYPVTEMARSDSVNCIICGTD